MASEKPELDGYETALEARVAKWQAALDAYRAARSIDGPLGEIVSGVGTAAGASRATAGGVAVIDLPVGVFRDKTIKEAIVIYLGAGRRKQTNKEIATGLQRGGIATTATNFEATVATALYRLKEEGTLHRFDDGWDLAASYPDNLRGRLEKDAKPRRTKTAKSKKAKRRTPAKKAEKASVADGPRAIRIRVKPTPEPADLKAVG